MNCEEIGELLPDYLQGGLNADRAAVVEKHLAECAACGQEAALWQKLALLPEEQPSPALESRFKAMLESYQEGRWERSSLAVEKTKTPAPMLWGLGNWRQLPAAGIVWACLFLACGYFIGKRADGGANTEVQKQLADLQGELAATRQTVALSMLQQQSASQRLEGVSWTTRLAALDALSRYGDRPEVRRELVDVLQTTQSPMVQVALIDLLVDLHDKSAVPQFRKFQQDPHVNPTVKKRVDWGIQQLN